MEGVTPSFPSLQACFQALQPPPPPRSVFSSRRAKVMFSSAVVCLLCSAELFLNHAEAQPQDGVCTSTQPASKNPPKTGGSENVRSGRDQQRADMEEEGFEPATLGWE